MTHAQMLEEITIAGAHFRPCPNCDKPCQTNYCSDQCYLDYEDKTMCDVGHVHAAKDDCPECVEVGDPEEYQARLEAMYADVAGLR